MAFSKISVGFDADVSGLVTGTKQAEAAMSKLSSNIRTVSSAFDTLDALSGKGFDRIGIAAQTAGDAVALFRTQQDALVASMKSGAITEDQYAVALESVARNITAFTDSLSRGISITQQFATAEERLAASQREYADLLATGAISAETYSRAMRAATESYEKQSGAAAALLDAERERASVMQRAQAVIDSLLTSEERHAKQASDLADLYLAGALNHDQYTASLAKIDQALYESSDAYKAQIDAKKEFDALMAKGAAVAQSVATAEERHTQTLRELTQLLQAGAISQTTFDRAVEKSAASMKGTAVAADQLAKNTKKLADTNDRVESLLTKLWSLGKVFIGLKIAEWAARATGSLASFMQTATAAADQLAKFARRTGIAYADMAGFQVAADQVGVGIEALATAVSKADKKFIEATRGSKQAQEGFKLLGLSIQDMAGLDSAGRFEAIADAIAALPTEAQQAAAAMRLFEEAGIKLLPALQGGSAALKQAREQAEKLGLALTDQQGAGIEAMNDSLRLAYRTLEGLTQQVVAVLAPAVQSVADMWVAFTSDIGVADMAATITNAFWDAAEILARGLDLITYVTAPVLAAWEQLIGYFSGTVGTFFEGISFWGVATEVFQRAVSLLEGVAKGFVAGFQFIISGLAKVGEWFLGAVASAVEMIGFSADKLREMQAATGDYASSMYDSAMDFGTIAGQNIANAFSQDFVPTELGQQLATGFTGGAESMVEKLRAARSEYDENAAKKVGAAMQTAAEAVKFDFASAVDVRSKEGNKELIRLMYGSGAVSEEVKELRRQTAALDSIEKKIGEPSEILMAVV